MGKQFFSGWVLWQQMTFVLACGIVGTIFIGLCKLQYDKSQLRKYSKVEKGKQVQTPEMLEAQPVSIEPKEDDVPFGIRAIESGIEVDGVWISRSNTPVGSSRSSINNIKLSLPSSSNSSQLELPKAIHSGSSSRDSSRPPSSNAAFDRAVSAERIPTNNSRDSSPGRVNPNPFRGRPPVAFKSRYSNSNIPRNSTTLQALEGYSAESSNTSSKSSTRNSDDSDYMALPEGRPYEAAYINPKHTSSAVPFDPRTDLDLLQSHRMSHVAETGQLTPRVRRPGHSGEWASMAGNNMRSPQEILTSNGVDYFVPLQNAPPVPELPAEIPAPSMSKYNRDGHSTNQVRQAVPLLETYTPKARQMPETYQPRGPQHEYEAEPKQYEDQNPRFERTQSQVIRKVNSGFEILRPGTFPDPSSPEEVPEKRKSKRLQKRRTSSGASRTSHFVEQV